jgi:hypothetical protein
MVRREREQLEHVGGPTARPRISLHDTTVDMNCEPTEQGDPQSVRLVR